MPMYKCWEFLRRIHAPLEELAVGPFVLPDNTLTTLNDLMAEAVRFGLKLPDPAYPPQRQIRSLQSKLTQHRAKVVDKLLVELRRSKQPIPSAWVEWSERLDVDADPEEKAIRPKGHPLAQFWPDEERRIHGCFSRYPRYRFADAHERQEIRNNVTYKLYIVGIRNAGKWYALGNHDTEWWGYIFRQLPALVRRS